MEADACSDGGEEDDYVSETRGSAFGRSWSTSDPNPLLSFITCRAYDDLNNDRAADRQSDRETDSADRDRRERESSLDRSDDRPYWALTGEERAERARELRQEAQDHNKQAIEHAKDGGEALANGRCGTAVREMARAGSEALQANQCDAHAAELEIFPDGRPGRDMQQYADATPGADS